MWLKIVKPIDSLIDGISMYRLLLYYLVGLLLAAIGLSLVGDIHYSAKYIALSATTLVLACWIINKIFGWIFDAPINPESSILTGLILALIITPSFAGYGFLFLLAASGLAIASKFILTIDYKHIFNPAAIAVVLTALGPRQSASWWIGTAPLLPFVLIGGVLIARKVRREHMLITFLLATTLTTAFYAVQSKENLYGSMHNMVLSSAIFFLGFVMLTEPYTSPATRGKQLVYAVIVGFLMAPQVHFGNFYTSPEIALVVGNIFAYLVSPKIKLFPTLKEKVVIAKNTLELVFVPDLQFAYEPGQYMEFTLPHSGTDSRGARRYFTLASSPTEKDIKLGVKFYENGSSYKSAMAKMDNRSLLVASQLAGDFVMPKKTTKKLAFIAGGIGVTPFRSMVKYITDTNEQRTITMLYSARTEEDFAYKNIFSEGELAFGLRMLYLVTDKDAEVSSPNTVKGMINKEIITRAVPDYKERIFYISGTHNMVEDAQEILKELGVHHRNIKIDFFPGYA